MQQQLPAAAWKDSYRAFPSLWFQWIDSVDVFLTPMSFPNSELVCLAVGSKSLNPYPVCTPGFNLPVCLSLYHTYHHKIIKWSFTKDHGRLLKQSKYQIALKGKSHNNIQLSSCHTFSSDNEAHVLQPDPGARYASQLLPDNSFLLFILGIIVASCGRSNFPVLWFTEVSSLKQAHTLHTDTHMGLTLIHQSLSWHWMYERWNDKLCPHGVPLAWRERKTDQEFL